jgi:hypothetical protein
LIFITTRIAWITCTSVGAIAAFITCVITGAILFTHTASIAYPVIIRIGLRRITIVRTVIVTVSSDTMRTRCVYRTAAIIAVIEYPVTVDIIIAVVADAIFI